MTLDRVVTSLIGDDFTNKFYIITIQKRILLNKFILKYLNIFKCIKAFINRKSDAWRS
jgi:hypothetical protein